MPREGDGVDNVSQPESTDRPGFHAVDEQGLPDDAKLIRESLEGGHAAFGILVRRYTPMVLAYLYGKTRNDPDAEDVLQETFETAYAKLPKLRRSDRFGPWLLAIARSRLADAQRRTLSWQRVRQSPEHVNRQQAASPPAETPDGSASFTEVQRVVLESIGQLSDSYRVVVYLRLVEELGPHDIAKRLGLKESAARVRLLRGLRRLRKHLEEKGIRSRAEFE